MAVYRKRYFKSILLGKSKHTKNEIAICLFAYNRYEHLRVTLERLLQEDLTAYSIFIFQDGPKNIEDETAVGKVSDYLQSLDHSSIEHVQISKTNMGLAKSVFSGLDKVFSLHNSVIVLEDDILIRPGFLEFISLGLNTFEISKQCSRHSRILLLRRSD